MTASNASLIPQIRDAYKKVIEASKGTLGHAFECGRLLNLAKKGMQEKAWQSWLRDNFPQIPQTTASLYMRLAANKDVIDKQRVAYEAEGGLMSIRSAAKLIPPTRKALKAAETRAKVKAEREAIEAKQTTASRASFDLPELLTAVGPDEVVMAIQQAKWDRGLVEELVSRLTTVLNGKSTTTEEKLAAELSASQSSSFTRRSLPTQ
jgi:hypothetical protein